MAEFAHTIPSHQGFHAHITQNYTPEPGLPAGPLEVKKGEAGVIRSEPTKKGGRDWYNIVIKERDVTGWVPVSICDVRPQPAGRPFEVIEPYAKGRPNSQYLTLKKGMTGYIGQHDKGDWWSVTMTQTWTKGLVSKYYVLVHTGPNSGPATGYGMVKDKSILNWTCVIVEDVRLGSQPLQAGNLGFVVREGMHSGQNYRVKFPTISQEGWVHMSSCQILPTSKGSTKNHVCTIVSKYTPVSSDRAQGAMDVEAGET